jgi:hypothetical protein
VVPSGRRLGKPALRDRRAIVIARRAKIGSEMSRAGHRVPRRLPGCRRPQRYPAPPRLRPAKKIQGAPATYQGCPRYRNYRRGCDVAG